MDANQNGTYDAALAGCARLKELFPQDRHLGAVMEQLHAWRNGQRKCDGVDAVSDRQRRNIDRPIRPLCEEVANLVHEAELYAKQLPSGRRS
jgi:hypothetical protein